MVVTQAHALEDRIRSYELLSVLMGGVAVGR
jgi:hypothetical protein